jgi:hypothetical protein
MNLSRSMSSITCSTWRFEWSAMSSAIRRVVESTSRAWMSMSLGVPRKPAEPWWIIIFAFGSADRFPGEPPQRIIAAADMAIPTQIVRTSGLTNCIAS